MTRALGGGRAGFTLLLKKVYFNAKFLTLLCMRIVEVILQSTTHSGRVILYLTGIENPRDHRQARGSILQRNSEQKVDFSCGFRHRAFTLPKSFGKKTITLAITDRS